MMPRYATAAIMAVTFSTSVQAIEHSLQGIVDVRYHSTDSIQSYNDGGVGKFSNNDGSRFSLAQAGFDYQAEFNDQWSAHVVVNGIADGVNDNLGLTELYASYRGLPSESGIRHQFKIGSFYPSISFENRITAWASRYTLTPSVMNSWIGEELRSSGVDYRWLKLGSRTGADYDLSLNASLFYNNDPAGAMLSWHGWMLSHRQTAFSEKLPLPDFPARNGMLAGQAAYSDPFLELDHQPGYQLGAELTWPRLVTVQFGVWDNQATPYKVEKGQYGWRTRFHYLGTRWHINKQWTLIAQAMQGSTLMQSPQRMDVVNNSFATAYLMLNWRDKKQQVSGRIEHFSVDDRDQTYGDNNEETGRAITLGYQYRFQPQLYLTAEYNWIESKRPGRHYQLSPIQLIERQLQFGVRYFFR